MSYPALGHSDVLCLPDKKKVSIYYFFFLFFFSVQDCSDTTVLSHVRRVATWKILMTYFTGCIVKNEVMQKKIFQRYADGNCFIDMIVIVFVFL